MCGLREAPLQHALRAVERRRGIGAALPRPDRIAAREDGRVTYYQAQCRACWAGIDTLTETYRREWIAEHVAAHSKHAARIMLDEDAVNDAKPGAEAA